MESAQSAADPLGIVGTVISAKYLVERMVDEGGFSLIYRALHRIWNQPVALKCFKLYSRLSPDKREAVLEEFIREGALLSELSRRSASIVQARDVGTFTTPEGAVVAYLVLEWLDGSSLDSILKAERTKGVGAPWPEDRVIRVLDPVAIALDLVHRQGIAHRDVKPANIFITGGFDSDDMLVKVLDFGIAKVVGSAESSVDQTHEEITSFTPRYGAPEQFSRSHGATGPWTDVYALALVFGELLSGRPALGGHNFIQLGISTSDPGRRPTPRTLGANVNVAIEAACARALAIEPEKRFATAGEFWDAIRAAVGLASLLRKPLLRSGSEAKPPVLTMPSASAASPRRPELPATLPDVAIETPPARKGRAGFGLGVLAAAVAALSAIGLWRSARRNDGIARPPTTAVAAPVRAAASAQPVPPACPKDMIYIAGGKFFMGDDGGEQDERPAHQVILSSYCIDVHETTVAGYAECVSAGRCASAPTSVAWQDLTATEKKAFSTFCNGADPARSPHPINCVDWKMASAYCELAGSRLPTEAEWEFAARGSDGRKYPWGDEEPDSTRLNACGKECVTWASKNGVVMRPLYAEDDGFAGTAPVGSFPLGSSPFGLVDVVGNVWEWVSDWDGAYHDTPETNPTGPKSGTRRVVRGGAFNGAYASWVRPTRRYSDRPETRSHAYGFRCAKGL